MKLITYKLGEVRKDEMSYARTTGYLIGTIRGILQGVEGGYAKVDKTTTELLIKVLLEIEDQNSDYSKQQANRTIALAENLGYKVVNVD